MHEEDGILLGAALFVVIVSGLHDKTRWLERWLELEEGRN